MKCEDYHGVPRLGFYTVGNKNFYYKQSVMLEMSRTKQPASWNFAQDVFAAAAAKPRSQVPLTTWYKLRAQQLRDQSDYLILAYSGGADSDTVLKTFINNNIKLDEVWCDQPFEFTEKSQYVPNRSTDSTNIISEWFYVTKPELEKLSQTHPETKIHCSDSLVNFSEDKFERQFGASLSYQTWCRYHYIDRYVRNLREKHPRITLIYGIDKLIPVIQKKQIGFALVDGATFFKEDYIDYFFWTPDMPELVVEQAHHVWDYLRNDLKPLVIRNSAANRNLGNWANRATNMDALVKKITYPDWDFAKHQVNKPPSMLENNQYDPLVNYFSKERFYQATVSNSKNIFNQYDTNIVLDKNVKNCAEFIKFRNAHMIGTLS
jgi:hypothetical protein